MTYGLYRFCDDIHDRYVIICFVVRNSVRFGTYFTEYEINVIEEITNVGNTSLAIRVKLLL